MIQIKDLTFGYHPRSTLFQNLNLSLSGGHIYGLLGKNGAGKSTLLKNIVGLIPPGKGSCEVKGINSSGRPVEVLEDLFFLPEDIFVPSVTVVQFMRSTGLFYNKFKEDEFYHALKAFDIDPNSRLDKLSYGQQKKAMVAFSLATNTSLLIMDEPTNGLDIPSKAQFRKLVSSALNESRCIIISTHQVRDLENLIDALIVLHDHKIILSSSIDAIAERLNFGTPPNSSSTTILYEEEGIAGKQAIMPNNGSHYTKIDLELLFNALTNGNTEILKLLNTVYA